MFCQAVRTGKLSKLWVTFVYLFSDSKWCAVCVTCCFLTVIVMCSLCNLLTVLHTCYCHSAMTWWHVLLMLSLLAVSLLWSSEQHNSWYLFTYHWWREGWVGLVSCNDEWVIRPLTTYESPLTSVSLFSQIFLLILNCVSKVSSPFYFLR